MGQTLNKGSWEYIQKITTITTTCPGNICPGDICPYQQYVSGYWPDFDQTLSKGSWEHIQQITSVTTTFVQATFVLATFVHISNISDVTDSNSGLQKDRYRGTSGTKEGWSLIGRFGR